jgi:hypothetical protein
MYSVSPKRGESRRTLVPDPLAIRALTAACAPGNIAAMMQWKVADSPLSAEVGSDGLVHLKAGRTTFVVDSRDSTVVGWTEDVGGASTVETRFVDWQSAPIFQARFPRLGYTRSKQPKRPDFYTILVFGVPRTRPDLVASDFVWSKYADTMRDSKTGEVWGTDGQLVASDSPEPARQSPPAVFLADPKTVRANAADPSIPVLPASQSSVAIGLRIVGLVFLLLAGAWAIRKRLG